MNAFRITINRQIFTEIMSSNYGYGMDLKTSRIYPAVDWISGGGGKIGLYGYSYSQFIARIHKSVL